MDADRRDEGRGLRRDKAKGRNERPQWGEAEGGTSDAITANCQGRGGQLNSLDSALLWHARRCLSIALGDWRRAELVDIAPDAGANVLVDMGVWVLRAE